MKLFYLFIILSLFKCVLLQTIESIGPNSNDQFQWASGISGLKFSLEYNCSNVAGICRYFWWLGATQVAVVDSSTCVESQSYVSLQCNVNGDIVQSNLTITKSLTATVNLRVSLPSTDVDQRTLNIKNCTNSSEGLVNGQLQDELLVCGYGCKADVICEAGYSNNSSQTTCQSDATWSSVCKETTTIGPTTRTNSSPTGQAEVSTESAASNDVSSTTSDNSTRGNEGNPNNNGGLSDGAIAGIVIAVVVVVGAGVAGIVVYFKKSGYIPGSTK